jgi:acetyltransferase-like isoleucine patch superfamily enzyme
MLGYCGNNVTMRNLKGFPSKSVKRMYLYDNVVVKSFSLISVTGKFIMKENSGASTGLIVITGNHQRKAGQLFILEAKSHDLDIEEDVIVEEDVWLGANVTLLAGVTIGRGATVGAGAVCFKSIPPYSIAVGNPAKVVGFNFTPEEILAHEEKLYPKETRLSKDTLEKNYKKYFLDRIKEIKSFTRI